MGDETRKTINFGSKTEFLHVFSFSSAPPLLLRISFTAPNCTTTIISLEPCALNAEYEQFILRFIKRSLLYWDLLKGLYFADTTERGDRGWKEEAQRQGEDRVTLRITLICKLKYLSYSLDEVPPQFNFFFCNEPIWLVYHSKINKNLKEVPSLHDATSNWLHGNSIPKNWVQLFLAWTNNSLS
jgi:hypothetical protein